jgi:hypothetical protein
MEAQNMRTILFLSLSTALALGIGCGDDSMTGDTGTGGDTSLPDTGGGGDSSADTGGGGDTSVADTGGGDTGGDGGTGAAAWCEDYEDTCGFGAEGRYDDAASCIEYYDDASPGCVTCIETHLDNAEMEMPDLHCPHAAGEGACAGPC